MSELMKSNFVTINQMFDPPDGWLRASLPKLEAITRTILRSSCEAGISFEEAKEKVLKNDWFSVTGKDPSETCFTIIIPVHNEARTLPSFLGALLTSSIPDMADIQVVFVVNASTDQSAVLIRDRLAHLHQPVTKEVLPPSAYDPHRSGTAFLVSVKGLRFLVVETLTPGKANALNVGNEIALSRGHDIAMNIDANNWVEPDSISLLFRDAWKYILSNTSSKVVIVNANEYYAKTRTQFPVSAEAKVLKAEVTGWMFAWSTKWISENNGFSRCAIEDYAAGLMALAQGRQIECSSAPVWGFAAFGTSDEGKQNVRYLYGCMQLARQFQRDLVATQILLGDFPDLMPVFQRLEYHIGIRSNSNKILGLIKGVYQWLRREVLIFRAWRKFNKDPLGQTWEPINSTKHDLSAPTNMRSVTFMSYLVKALVGKLIIFIDEFQAFIDFH